jgi:protein kinase-like protein/PEGA domain-containing protein
MLTTNRSRLDSAERRVWDRQTRWLAGLDSAIMSPTSHPMTELRICPRCRASFGAPHVRCPSDQAKLLSLGPGHDDIVSDKYVVLGRLGLGGTSKVYRAYKPQLEKEVALKVLSGADARDRDLVERFRGEATSAGQLRSPHTVRVYDFGWLESGEPFIEMELLTGRSLDAIVQEEAPLSPERVERIVHQICLSLEEAHAQNRVHRDIKPKNIMVERRGERDDHVTVLDFGLVKRVGNLESTLSAPTDPQIRVGTPQYMAPELWSGAYGETGPGVDIYALGIVIFQMLTGKAPFSAATEISQLIAQHLYQAPAPLSAYVQDQKLIDRFDPIIRRCLAKRPSDRFGTIGELKQAVAPARPPAGPKAAPRADADRSAIRGALGASAFLSFAIALVWSAAEIVDRALIVGTGEAVDVRTLIVESNPPAADVFIDGEPTGLTTPASVRGLHADRTISIVVKKETCAPKSESVTLRDPEQKLSLSLDCE